MVWKCLSSPGRVALFERRFCFCWSRRRYDIRLVGEDVADEWLLRLAKYDEIDVDECIDAIDALHELLSSHCSEFASEPDDFDLLTL